MTRKSSAVHDAASESPDGRRAPETPLAVHVALLFVQIAFGSLAVEGKVVMSPRFGVAPEGLAMARILGGALVFVPAYLVARARGGAGATATTRIASWRDRVILAALAFFGVVLNQALFLRGLHETSPVAATLLVATIPVFTAVLSVITGREKIRSRMVLGLILAVSGVVVLSGFSLPRRGDALVLLNSLSYAIYIVASKDMLARHGSLAVMAYVFGWGALLFAPIGGVRLFLTAPGWSWGAIGLVVYVVLVPTVLAYGLNAWALRRASPTLVTIYIYLQPVVVVALAAIQLGQVPTILTLLGGLFILAGVAIVARMKADSKVVP